MYDVGAYNSDDDKVDQNGMGDFLNEMAAMMNLCIVYKICLMRCFKETPQHSHPHHQRLGSCHHQRLGGGSLEEGGDRSKDVNGGSSHKEVGDTQSTTRKMEVPSLKVVQKDGDDFWWSSPLCDLEEEEVDGTGIITVLIWLRAQELFLNRIKIRGRVVMFLLAAENSVNLKYDRVVFKSTTYFGGETMLNPNTAGVFREYCVHI